MKKRMAVGATATGSSIGLSTLAAAVGLCCVAPWAVALLGVSGAVALAGLAPFQPYFIAAAVVLFAAAVWIAYRPRNLSGTAACNRRSPWLTRLFVVNALLLVLAIFAGSVQAIIQRYLLF